jgi:hypothetical protein
MSTPAPRPASSPPTVAAEPAWSEGTMSAPEAETSVLDAFALQSSPDQASAPPPGDGGPSIDAAGRAVCRGRFGQAGPIGATAASAADQDDFSRAFNREFAALLHVFSETGAAAAERGPATTSVTIAQDSGEHVTAERLRALFTSAQRDLLMQFITTRRIPDLLFNGAEPNATTVQQRVLMAGHILANGEYQPGSFSQRMYARMCGHWVNLVNHYAGVGEGLGAGIREQFDHAGMLSISVMDGEDGVTANRRGGGERAGQAFHHGRWLDDFDDGQSQHSSQGQMAGLDKDRLDQLEPGDWLWYFNDNGGRGGNHSVVFSRWATGWMDEDGPRPYRRAICMSQFSPSEGGRSHTALLGPRAGRAGDARITPVTHVSRQPASARPLRTAADLIALLGSGPEAEANRAYIERMGARNGGTIDHAQLLDHLRGRNAALIDQLRARMHGHQQQAFDETNRSTEIGVLVRLNERLAVLARNASVLDTNEAAQSGRVEAQHSRSAADTEPRRTALEGQLREIDETIERGSQEHEDAVARWRELDPTDELRARIRERRGLLQQRREGRERVRGLRDEVERAAAQAELDAVGTRIQAVQFHIDRLTRDQRTDRAAIREARQTARRIQVDINRANLRRGRVEADLRRIRGAAGFYMAHAANRNAFNGRGEGSHGRATTGLLQRLDPQPPWASMITRQAGGEG